MRYLVAVFVLASVASAGPIVISGFDPTEPGLGESDPVAGNFGSLAFIQDALFYLGDNAGGAQRIAVFRNDPGALSAFSAGFSYAGAGFGNTSNPDVSQTLGGVDGDANLTSDWEIGFYDAADIGSFLLGAPIAGTVASYDGASPVTAGPGGPTTLADVGIIVLFDDLGDPALFGALQAFADAGGGIFGIGNGPGTESAPDSDFDWLPTLFPGIQLPSTMEAGSLPQGPSNGGSAPATGAYFPNWERYFLDADGSTGGIQTNLPESFSTVNLNTLGTLSSVIGQTDGGNVVSFGETTQPIPEPGTIVLLGGIGLVLLLMRIRASART